MEREALLGYPRSSSSNEADIIHGVRVPDPYRWLEDINSERTQSWIAAENEVTRNYLSQIPVRKKIYRRISELWNYEKYSVPFKRGGRYFFTRNDGLQNHSVLYWMDSLDAEAKVLLDPNQLSEDGSAALIDVEVSEDGQLLAYGISTSGSDWEEWKVREIDTGQDRKDHLKWIKASGASWTHDNQGFFYSRFDEPKEGMEYKGTNYYHKLYYHRLGTPQYADELIYERPDQKEWGFSCQVTEDGHYLIITVWRGVDRNKAISYKDLQKKSGRVVELIQGFEANFLFIGNDGPVFYFMTDFDALRSRVIAIDINRPNRSNWKQIIPESIDTLQTVNLVQDMFFACYLHNAHSRVLIFNKTGRIVRELDLPGIVTVSEFSSRRKDQETFYLVHGFTMPGKIYRYDIETGKTSVFRESKVDFDSDAYVTEQVFYKSKDGTQVPMFISYKKGLVRDGNNPTYLYGYGGFKASLTPIFSVANLVWMEMGGIYTQANLRGGAEYGTEWYEAGIKLKKQNVFDDFIAAAEWLVENKFTSTSKLAIGGSSNGGLLVAACLTQRPDLFGACLVDVGVLDMLRFHKFTVGWAWISDYGNPENPEEFKVLLAYSPYHNINPGVIYPATLITTADHDDRVFPAHSFKFAAALQAAQVGTNPILIRIETKAGHGLSKPTSKIIEEVADQWAFLNSALGMGTHTIS